jgi:hypothetical protein
MLASTAVRLPAGWLDGAGILRREAVVRPLCGDDEEWLYAVPLATPEPVVVTELLARCVQRIGLSEPTHDTIRELAAGDREWLVLRLWQLTLGDRVKLTLGCPRPVCGARLDVDFAISALPVEERPQRPEYRLIERVDGTEYRVRFRLPRGGDLEALAGRSFDAGPAGPAAALIERCVLGIDPPVEGGFAGLTAPLAARMRQHSALVQRDFDATCPDCGRSFGAGFDPILAFLTELLRRRPEFEHDVHLLSLNYHWTLSEILALTRPRRRRYVRVLNAYTEPRRDGR